MFALGACLALAAGPAQANTSGAPSGLQISVAGNHLVDANGRPVTLRGVDLSGTEFACAQGWDGVYGDQPLDQASTYAAMQEWKVNVVRVPLNEDCWLAINNVKPTASGAAYRDAIRTEVDLIHSAGMYAILDLHWSAPAAQLALSQNPAPDADHSLTFWRQVAEAYRSDRAVIFDLFNEPYDYWGKNSDHWAGWLNGDTYGEYVTGGSPYTVSTQWRTVGVQALVNVIRDVGATQPILVNGLDWANDLSGWLTHTPHDPARQLVAGWHVYPGQSCSSTACWDSVIAPIAQRFPVVVGETGDSSGGAQIFLPRFLSWADRHGVSYLAWTWNPWQDGSNVLIKDWGGTPTDGEGAFYKQELALAPVASVAVPTAKALSPAPPGARGWTIVYLGLLGLLAAGTLAALLARRRLSAALGRLVAWR
jgi:endoglucanase